MNDGTTSSGQVTRSAAEVYEAFFEPALFQEWAPRLADAARVEAGERVLDVGCGTGVLAREAVRRGATVTGLDRNPGMLAVAGRTAPAVDWRAGMAESLPFAEGSFDAVVSQFALMFFEDRAAALSEMRRVLRSDGRLAVAVWDVLDHSPGYAAMAALLQRLFGSEVADQLRAPFLLGEIAVLRSLFAEAGLADVEIRTLEGTARFPSIDSWIHTDVKGWTLADMIDDAQYDKLLAEARKDLTAYVLPDDTVAFAIPAHIVTAVKV